MRKKFAKSINNLLITILCFAAVIGFALHLSSYVKIMTSPYAEYIPLFRKIIGSFFFWYIPVIIIIAVYMLVIKRIEKNTKHQVLFYAFVWILLVFTFFCHEAGSEILKPSYPDRMQKEMDYYVEHGDEYNEKYGSFEDMLLLYSNRYKPNQVKSYAVSSVFYATFTVLLVWCFAVEKADEKRRKSNVSEKEKYDFDNHKENKNT